MASIQLNVDLDHDDFRTYDGDINGEEVEHVLDTAKNLVDEYLRHANTRPAMVTYNLRPRWSDDVVGTLTVQE